MFELELDEEITLRHVQESDAPEMFRLTDASREELREWLPWVDGTRTRQDSLTFIQLTLDAYEARRGLNCGVFYKGKLTGMVSFNLIDWQNRTGHIGYWLATAYSGQGIMTRAVRGLIDYGFYELELNRIEIRAAVENKKSRAIPERLSFQQEGMIRQAEWLYDHFVDHAVYGILRAEWV
jgi:ribosomal-protein-serine acetyltransferase